MSLFGNSGILESQINEAISIMGKMADSNLCAVIEGSNPLQRALRDLQTKLAARFSELKHEADESRSQSAVMLRIKSALDNVTTNVIYTAKRTSVPCSFGMTALVHIPSRHLESWR